MAILRKRNAPLNLELIDVFIDDNTISSEYFQVYNIPNILPGGKSAFLINGSNLLKLHSEVKIEVKDSLGNVIYSEYPQYLEGTARLVSVYVYEDTPYGIATITIIGEAENVPEEWKGLFNVRWSTNVLVDPSLPNIEPIRFYNIPKIQVKEKRVSYLRQDYISGSIIQYTTGSISGRDIGGKYILQAGDVAQFTGKMAGGTLVVPAPSLSIDSTDQYGITGSRYTTIIDEVINSKLALARSGYALQTPGSAENSFDNAVFKKTNYPFVAPFVESAYTISYAAPPTYSLTENYQSFAQLRIYDMTTVSGDINKIKLFQKSAGTVGDWQYIDEIVLEGIELFVNTSSMTLNERLGKFDETRIITNYWNAAAIGFVGNPTLSKDDTKIIDALRIQPPVEDYDATDYVHISCSIFHSYYSDNEYTLSFKSYGTKSNKYVISKREGSDNAPQLSRQAKLSFYISGSAFSPTNKLHQEFGRLIKTVIVSSSINTQEFGYHETNFIPNYSGSGQLQIVIDSGEWYVSDISIASAKETGFSPDSTLTYVPIRDWHRNDSLKFKVEFFDINGKKSYTSIESIPVRFTGSNLYVGGTDNLITGSMYISNVVNRGVEFAGQQSAYIRNVGYLGWNKANEGSGSGFMLWSGSVNPALPYVTASSEYSAVGIELHGGLNSSPGGETHAMRFRTDTGKLEITGSIFATDGVFSGTLSIGTFPSYPNDDILRLYLNFENNLLDQSGNSYHGVILSGSFAGTSSYGVATYLTNSIVNKSILLESEHYVKVSSASVFDSVYEFTANMWVYPTNNITGIFSITDTAYANGFYIYKSGSELKIESSYFGGSNFSQSFEMPINQWSMLSVAYAKDSDTVYIYRNGTLLNSQTVSTLGYSANRITDIYIGQIPSIISGSAIIDEFRIYEGILNSQQIQSLYLYPGGSQGSIISGDQIQSGKLISNNWNNNNRGSLINLNDGTIMLGGSGSNAPLYYDGSTLFISGTLSIGSIPTLPSDKELSMYYNFDNNLLDQSGNNNNPILTGSVLILTASFATNSVVNRAILLNNTKYLKVLSSSIWEPTTGNMTINFWYYGSGSSDGLVALTNHVEADGFHLHRIGTTGVSLSSSYWGGVDHILPISISNNEWTMLSFVFNKPDNILTSYKNGEFISITDIIDLNYPATSTGRLYIGGDRLNLITANSYFDEFRIYKQLLTSKQILALYSIPGGSQGSVISGDQIRSGRLISNNWNELNRGSLIDLNNGTVMLGGSGSNAPLYYDGTTLYLSGSLAVSSVPGFPPDDELTLYFNFNNNLLDQSGNEKNAVVYPSASGLTISYSSQSVSNRSILLNDSKYLRVSTASIWEPINNNFSINFWIHTTASNAGLFAINNVLGNSGLVAYRNGTTQVVFSSSQYGGVDYEIPVSISDGEWTMLSFVFNLGTDILSSYKNGELIDQRLTDKLAYPTSSYLELYIGGDGSNISANGYYDEWRVYKKLISSNEITALYLYPGGNPGSVISGNQIKTGQILSNNWNGSNAGSLINLDDGTIMFGGSGSNASLYFDGTNLYLSGSISASSGEIANWKIESERLYSNVSGMYISSSGEIATSDGTGSRVIIDGVNNVLQFYDQVGDLSLEIGDKNITTFGPGSPLAGSGVSIGVLDNNSPKQVEIKNIDSTFSTIRIISNWISQWTSSDNFAWGGVESWQALPTDTVIFNPGTNPVFGNYPATFGIKGRISAGGVLISQPTYSGSYGAIVGTIEKSLQSPYVAPIVNGIMAAIYGFTNVVPAGASTGKVYAGYFDGNVRVNGIATASLVESTYHSASYSTIGTVRTNDIDPTTPAGTVAIGNATGRVSVPGLLINNHILQPNILVKTNTTNTDYSVTIQPHRLNNAATGLWGNGVRPMMRWYISTLPTFNLSPTVYEIEITYGTGSQVSPRQISSSSLNTGVGNSSGIISLNITSSWDFAAVNHYIYAEIEGKVYSSSAFPLYTELLP